QRALFAIPAPAPAREKPEPFPSPSPATASAEGFGWPVPLPSDTQFNGRPAPQTVPPPSAQVSEPQAHYASGDLDAAHQQAVEAQGGPVVVVAGPGAGKTRTLTHRIAHLMHQRGVSSGQILAVTFTKRAAAEMHSRLRQLLSGSAVDDLRIGTFHRLALDFMR